MPIAAAAIIPLVFIEISRLGAGLADILRPSAGPGGAFLGEEALGQGR
jgi:hypothetical protein